MARGYFGGLTVGIIVSGLSIGVIANLGDSEENASVAATSQDVETIETSIVESDADEVAVVDEAISEATDEEINAAAEETDSLDTALEVLNDDVPQIAQAPEISDSLPDDLSALENADTQPALLPETGVAEGELVAPTPSTDTAQVESGNNDEPIVTTPQSDSLQAPDQDFDVAISTEPAQPKLPDADLEETAFPADESAAQEPSQDEGGIVAEQTPGVIENTVETVQTPDAELVSQDLPSLERFALSFDNPDNKPLMSIILIDRGENPIDEKALNRFPFPISFALDASWPGAAAAAQRYRDAGHEVLTMVNLPNSATVGDVQATLPKYLSAIPGSVAVMEGDASGLQSSREVSQQIAPILLESGHGLVMFQNGLNTTQKLIEREGVRSSTVFRDFDAQKEDSKAIRRFLDHGAFKADRSEGGVIMVGRLRDETLSALLLWGLQGRADRVTMAPISAVLLDK